MWSKFLWMHHPEQDETSITKLCCAVPSKKGTSFSWSDGCILHLTALLDFFFNFFYLSSSLPAWLCLCFYYSGATKGFCLARFQACFKNISRIGATATAPNWCNSTKIIKFAKTGDCLAGGEVLLVCHMNKIKSCASLCLLAFFGWMLMSKGEN